MLRRRPTQERGIHLFTTAELWAEIDSRTDFINVDADLVERAVRRAHKPHRARWAIVAQTFTVGSGRAESLCRRFGLDPDEVGP